DDVRRRLQDLLDNRRSPTGLRLEEASHLLRLGRIEPAIEVLERSLHEVSARTDTEADVNRLLLRLAVASLRKAETENCIDAHCAGSCIFPLEADGRHQRPEGARSAAKYLARFLSRGPHAASEQFTAVWLLNIAQMALGGWPEAVDAQYRLDASLFAPAPGLNRFTDIAPKLGVDAFDLAGGAIVDDFDNDGLLDIVTSTSDPCLPLHYYHNNGDGTFTDRADASGLTEQLGGLNINHADYDNDGRLDILVMRGAWLGDEGRQRLSLLLNEPDVTFADVTEIAGLGDWARPTQSADWADYDLDGDLDLYVAGETGTRPQALGAGRKTVETYSCALFRNNGDGTFTDVARAAGVTNDQYAKAVVWGDYDDDGMQDIYVSNLGGPNRLYRNNGDGTFSDVAESAGVREPIYSFPAWFFDYDNDGRLDLFVAAYEGDVGMLCAEYLGHADRVRAARMKIYHNTGDGRFEDRTRELGLYRLAYAMGANYGDIDNDGWLDFYLGTGAPPYECIVPNLMFRNDRGRRFVDVTTAGGFGHLQKGHGVAFGDLDNDGDQDIYHQLGGFYPGDAYGNALFLNPGNGNHWITLRLRGTKTNRFAVGARLTLTVEDGGVLRTIHRRVDTGGSFGASPHRVEVGLGKAVVVESLEIEWPVSRTRQVFRGLPGDRIIEITEGDDTLRTITPTRVPL
ncbi:MAG: CRTAC1 family protein, partial [Planctomycetota bacterium]|nr:CRTAC1 family protein [Planctomycetota bacterium]